MTLMIECGARPEHILMLDRKGVIHAGRDDLNEYKQAFAIETDKRTLMDAMEGADAFLGLSGANLLPAEGLALMADKPVVFACSNPDPEINPELAKSVRPDVIFGTGRSDYPNQVNNVLCFPFLFRGALDVRASCINMPMKIAAVKALAELAKLPVPEEVMQSYPESGFMTFGPDYVLPKPTDPRLKPMLPKRLRKLRLIQV